MNRRKTTTVLMGSAAYYNKIIGILGSRLIQFVPGWESSGATAADISGRGNHGAYIGVGLSLANAQTPTGKNAPYYNGVAAVTNLYSASLASLFNGEEGTFILQTKIAAAVWADNTVRIFYRLRTDVNNFIQIYKDTSNVLQLQYVSGGTNVGTSFVTTSEDWLTYSIRWSNSGEKAKYDINGAMINNAVSLLGTWSGALSATNVNLANSVNSSGSFIGWEANAIWCNAMITDAESLAIAKALDPQLKTISILGDSIPREQSTALQPWCYRVYPMKRSTLKNHAVSGETIVSHMATQAAAAAEDGANTIIIALGTNDDNAGNMTTLQATYEAGITALRASNPAATIYAMNVLPRWTNVGGGTPVDKGNIRTAIAAACTAQGITCWDTFSTPWIAAAQTSDGLHPTAAGHAAIATEVLVLLP